MSLSLNGYAKPLNEVVIQDSDDDSKLSPPLSPEGDKLKSDLSGVHKHHLDEIIPTTHSHRTIILCFDGTGDQFDEDVRTTFFKKEPPTDVSQNSRTPISFSSSPC